ncbi:PQQ-binding-like beta-propeller repeat protein [Halomicrococcus sp. NG-SE-24]|uniref:outer membrane protein assembly factor BamB family protein n=1 Tax=Halomicrococcus sp. NG-SE-24 TaxID=3436928 RepID=UPI003D95D7AB
MTNRTVDLGSVDPAGSRQLGRRSSVCLRDDAVVAGLADGSVVAFDADSLDERWRKENVSGSVVSLAPFADGFLVGERGPDGALRLLDADTGTERWSYRSADDVGGPTKRTRFFQPFVVDAVADDRRAYAAARRYHRGPDGDRTFESVVYAFAADGAVTWRYETDASPISLDVRNGNVAVCCNRCPGTDSDGLVVLDADTGAVRRRWNPPGDRERRVGDVSIAEDGIAVASHADYRATSSTARASAGRSTWGDPSNGARRRSTPIRTTYTPPATASSSSPETPIPKTDGRRALAIRPNTRPSASGRAARFAGSRRSAGSSTGWRPTATVSPSLRRNTSGSGTLTHTRFTGSTSSTAERRRGRRRASSPRPQSRTVDSRPWRNPSPITTGTTFGARTDSTAEFRFFPKSSWEGQRRRRSANPRTTTLVTSSNAAWTRLPRPWTTENNSPMPPPMTDMVEVMASA